MTGPHATSKGYSLVELLVVLAIMSLIALVAVPASLATLERMTLSADARSLLTDLRALRTEALDRQTDIVMTEVAGRLSASQGAAVELSPGTYADLGAAKRFVVRWDGTASDSITLRRGPARLRIAADPLTGRFAVEALK